MLDGIGISADISMTEQGIWSTPWTRRKPDAQEPCWRSSDLEIPDDGGLVLAARRGPQVETVEPADDEPIVTVEQACSHVDVLRFCAQPVQPPGKSPCLDSIHEQRRDTVMAVAMLNAQLPDTRHVVVVFLDTDLSYQFFSDKCEIDGRVISAEIGTVRTVSLCLLIWMLDGIDVEVIAVTAQGHLDARLYDEVAAEPVHVGGHVRCRPNDPYVETSHVIHTHIIHERRAKAGSRHSQPHFHVARHASSPLIPRPPRCSRRRASPWCSDIFATELYHLSN